VNETGAMKGELKSKYEKVIRQLDETGTKVIQYINGNSGSKEPVKFDPSKGAGFFKELAAMGAAKDKILNGPDVAELKAAVEKGTST